MTISVAHLYRKARRLEMLHKLPSLELQAEVSFDQLVDLSAPFDLGLAVPGADLDSEVNELEDLFNADGPGYGPEYGVIYGRIADKLFALAEAAELTDGPVSD